ncbi:hypothetical protein DFH09DRAFT_1085176 [Mycena vulgaris]|nr:hypothetical protein DFH09DRAFT_1085176 [Mycena vulgaris]
MSFEKATQPREFRETPRMHGICNLLAWIPSFRAKVSDLRARDQRRLISSEGYMTMLLREGFQHAPDTVFVLEATTPRSRDIYMHFGFEVVGEVTVGKGAVDAQGIRTSGMAAIGCHDMITPEAEAKDAFSRDSEGGKASNVVAAFNSDLFKFLAKLSNRFWHLDFAADLHSYSVINSREIHSGPRTKPSNIFTKTAKVNLKRRSIDTPHFEENGPGWNSALRPPKLIWVVIEREM